jgi:hypothetical protein
LSAHAIVAAGGNLSSSVPCASARDAELSKHEYSKGLDTLFMCSLFIFVF